MVEAVVLLDFSGETGTLLEDQTPVVLLDFSGETGTLLEGADQTSGVLLLLPGSPGTELEQVWLRQQSCLTNLPTQNEREGAHEPLQRGYRQRRCSRQRHPQQQL